MAQSRRRAELAAEIPQLLARITRWEAGLGMGVAAFDTHGTIVLQVRAGKRWSETKPPDFVLQLYDRTPGYLRQERWWVYNERDMNWFLHQLGIPDAFGSLTGLGFGSGWQLFAENTVHPRVAYGA